jgi:hypothetical protein
VYSRPSGDEQARTVPQAGTVTTESELLGMMGVRWGRWVAVVLLGGALAMGLPAMAGAQQPSDPSGCDSAYAGQDQCSDPGDDPAEVLGNVVERDPGGGGGGGLLPKTGADILVLVLAAGLAVTVGVALRRAGEHTART